MIAAVQTDVGKVREINQDAVYCNTGRIGKLNNLFIVADGMGGAKAGDKASRLLVKELSEYADKSNESSIPSLIRKGIEKANLKVFTESKNNNDYSGMGTTAVVATINGNRLVVANVGDSRLYIIDDNIRQITLDHSYVDELVKNGLLEKDSLDYKRKKNIITRAVGTYSTVETDFFEVELKQDDKVLLCSDGLSNMLTDTEILDIVHKFDINTAVNMLVDRANENGGKDNISVILIGDFENEVES